MLITVMQILDTSVINVALPHMQGALSAGVEEMAWVLTSYIAANAIVIPATGWLTTLLGRKRFFLICTTAVHGQLVPVRVGSESRVPRGWRAPSRGWAAAPIIPMAQALMWEIFPLRQRGMAMAVWGTGVMMGPILGPTLGGWIVDNWSWRWIFYINLPIGVIGFLMGLRLPLRFPAHAQAGPHGRPRARPDGDRLRVPAARARLGRARGLAGLRPDPRRSR